MKMSEKELAATAKEMGMAAIIKLISTKTTKLRKQDGMVRVADLIDQVVEEINSNNTEVKV